MRILRTIFFIVSVTIALNADNARPKPTLDSLLAQVKAAKGDARRQAMNRLKLYLRHASQASREEAMRRLRQTFGTTSGNHQTTSKHAPNMSHSQTYTHRMQHMQRGQIQQQVIQGSQYRYRHNPSVTSPHKPMRPSHHPLPSQRPGDDRLKPQRPHPTHGGGMGRTGGHP